MTEMNEKAIKRYFDESVRLPTNFAWRVAQKINARRLELARNRARLQTSLIAIFMCAFGAGLFSIYTVFYEAPAMALPFIKVDLLPAVIVLTAIFVLDSFAGLHRGD